MIPAGTDLGALAYREIYIEYDGPQFFSAESEQHRLFLVMHAPADNFGDNWLWRELTPAILSAVELNKIDLASAFAIDLDQGLYIVSWRDDVSILRAVKYREVPNFWFPRPGVFLFDGDEEEIYAEGDLALQDILLADDDVREEEDLSVEVAPIDAAPASFVWREDEDARAILASMRVSPSVVAEHTGRIICDFIIQPGIRRTDVGAAALGNFLTKTQRLVNALGEGPSAPKSKTAAARALKARMQLRAVAPFPGSFGLRLESATGSLTPDAELIFAFKTIFALIAAGHDIAAVRKILFPLGRRAAAHYRNFAKALAEVTGDFSAEIGIPGERNTAQVSIGGGEVFSLAKLLDQEVLGDSREEEFVGYLMGASIRNKLFLLEGANKSVSGRIADEAIPEMRDKKLAALHTAQIRTVTEVNEITGEEVERHILLAIRVTV